MPKRGKKSKKNVLEPQGEGVKLKSEDVVDIVRSPSKKPSNVAIPIRVVEKARLGHYQIYKKGYKPLITQGIMPSCKYIAH